MANNNAIILTEKVKSRIYLIRKEKVILDFDLAEMYDVETRALKQAVKRNLNRFPDDFMFQLKKKEWQKLITICDKLGPIKFSPALPFAFTEQGVAMLSSVLNSKRAIEVNIAIMRAFVQLRKFLYSNEKLDKKLKELENQTKLKFGEQQEQINLIFETIKELIKEESKPKNPIGFSIK